MKNLVSVLALCVCANFYLFPSYVGAGVQLSNDEMRKLFGGTNSYNKCICQSHCNYCGELGSECTRCLSGSIYHKLCKAYPGHICEDAPDNEVGCGYKYKGGTCNEAHACVGGKLDDEFCIQKQKNGYDCPEEIRYCNQVVPQP
ncbi:MAG: hypothetical protein NC906_09030 [Candidatus Omnitrophica bacterium]|nr:hypothetical protein [Candidatus Omnitrophota bacterium]